MQRYLGEWLRDVRRGKARGECDMSMKWAITRLNYSPVAHRFSLAGVSYGAAPTPDKTIYSDTSNKELKQKALQVVKSIRELVGSYDIKDRELMVAYNKKDQPKLRADARIELRDQ